ncbi:lipid A deacylase LpxR family protein [Mucilaginibacter phyllosphaerae]|uniref:Lipid A deacylase LpxR family protein n=1 Tax=Mucilaginibacter phyllosphaerae TaxID=1812349 RepID=A0A4Y8AL52_9SPHI|nr:lipid A deacylase LpxR family protein [Mucilaginibacter phyllosphaerae]MBB3967795.1 hypothetical protein [Mucilaginibacter phyllosphaerae]TEW69159.1 lipid A deacylase LpxR family protein [Mucilaginibacter phyllosphaerae]GGH03251.1 membrane protein [Mucilaginibacter phyllosphaerae]
MKTKLLLLAVFLFAVINTYAQTHTNEAGLQSDNDSFLAQGSDRYYTNGIYAYFRHALNAGKNDKMANKVLGFEAGQKIFNPRSGYIPAAQYVDRPFAGYLYVGSSLNLLYKNESNLKLSAKVGVIGPAAGAEGIQKFIHKTFGFYPPQGWQYQVRNEVQFNLSADYNKLLARTKGIDVSASGYANLGNGFTGAGVGPLFRLGSFNQLFHSVSTQSTVSGSDVAAPLHKHELFFYYKPQANYIAYDATIQGSLFKDHPEPGTEEITLTKKPFVLTNQIGGSLVINRFVFDVSVIFKSKEVKEMLRSQQWGSVTMLYRFK